MADQQPDVPLQTVRKPRSIFMIAMALGIAILFVLVAIQLISEVLKSYQSAQRARCKQQLTQIARALHEYHDLYGAFPPAYTVSPAGDKLHSWRSLILPFVGHKELWQRIHWDEPWDSQYNKEISKTVVEVYSSPYAATASRTCTNSFAIVGPKTVWPEQYAASIQHVSDGLSNTAQLISADIPGVHWMQPTDLTPDEAMRIVRPGDGSSKQSATVIALADGSVRWIAANRLNESQWRGMTSIASGQPFPGVAWPTSVEEVVDRDFPDPRPAAEFPQTEVWPVLDKEIATNKNVVYCATFQMAWDEIRTLLVGAEPQLDGGSSLVQHLNANPFPPGDLSPEFVVAHAGLGSKVVPLISDELAQKFPKFSSKLLDQADEYAFVAYAMLKKDLPFQFRFDRLEKPLVFSKTKVTSFGLEDLDTDDIRQSQIARQVKVLDYVSDDDFIIRLSPRGEADEIVMAKIPPQKTIREMVDQVRDRIRTPNPQHNRFTLEAKETLIAPVLSLDIDRRYAELIGKRFQNPVWSRISVMEARQIIHFRLDESGARLESEAVILGDFGGGPPRPRKLIFDRPFLIWLRESKAAEPYFVAWIANAELMESPNVR